MTIPERINLCMPRKYKMEYNLIFHTLIIQEEISVSDLILLKLIIKDMKLDIKNIIVEA